MDYRLYIELFGYLGSCLVVVSMLMSSVIKLRIINITGSIISATYALIIGSFPLALMNICLIIINVYNVYKLINESRKYEIVKGDTEDSFFQYFMSRNGEDIKQYYCDFQVDKVEGDTVYYAFCNDVPVGIFVGHRDGDKVAISVDYTVPNYRDCSVAKFLYIKLNADGINTLELVNPSKNMLQFLRKMGYKDKDNKYVKVLGVE